MIFDLLMLLLPKSINKVILKLLERFIIISLA